MSARSGRQARSGTSTEQAASSKRLYAPDNASSLRRYDEIPAWYQDNKFILSGHRPVTKSVRRCFDSLLYVHNETVNIYSHLLPALAASGAALSGDQVLVARYPSASTEDRVILALCLVIVVACFGLSTAYHTLMNHSARYSDLWGRIDYCGIMTLILGDFITGIYVGFYCEPSLQRAYWLMIASFSTLTALVVLNPTFQSRQYRTLRLCCFTATGLSAFAPILHALRLFPAKQLALQSGLNYYYTEGVIVLIAAAVYGFRFSEYRKPGRHDIVGASHQIFHVLTVLATAVHIAGLWSAYDYNYHNRRC